MNTLLLYLDLQYVSGQSSLAGSLELSTSASALNRSKYESLPPGRSSNVRKTIDTRYAFDGATVSFLKTVLEQTDFDGYGKPLYHLISWALLKRTHTHQHEIRRSKGKKKKKKLPLSFLFLLIVATTVVLEVIFPSSSIFACEKRGREGYSLTFFLILMLKLTP